MDQERVCTTPTASRAVAPTSFVASAILACASIGCRKSPSAPDGTLVTVDSGASLDTGGAPDSDGGSDAGASDADSAIESTDPAFTVQLPSGQFVQSLAAMNAAANARHLPIEIDSLVYLAEDLGIVQPVVVGTNGRIWIAGHFSLSLDGAFTAGTHSIFQGFGFSSSEGSVSFGGKSIATYVVPQWWGAVGGGGGGGDGKTSDSKAFQLAMSSVDASGGGAIFLPDPAQYYLLDFPVYIGSNTEVYGSGDACKITFLNPVFSKGRGGFVIGSSREANRDQALTAYASAAYPAVATENPSFVNLPPGTYLRDNPQMVQARGRSLHDIYLTAVFDHPNDTNNNWGGYGINLVNAWDCHVANVKGVGWTQLIGMGSDVSPETPSNYLCTATNLTVVQPDLVHTYYSIAFVANSTDCSVSQSTQLAPMTTNSPDGSVLATNYTENVAFQNIQATNVGLTQSRTEADA